MDPGRLHSPPLLILHVLSRGGGHTQVTGVCPEGLHPSAKRESEPGDGGSSPPGGSRATARPSGWEALPGALLEAPRGPDERSAGTPGLHAADEGITAQGPQGRVTPPRSRAGEGTSGPPDTRVSSLRLFPPARGPSREKGGGLCPDLRTAHRFSGGSF